jgi:hypothetical protein
VSPLTYWLSIAALVLIALFVVNAVAYHKRFGTVLRHEKRPTLKQALSKSEVGLYSFMVLGLLVGVAAPAVAPMSAFTRWLLEPYSQVVYFVWCALAPVVVNVAISLFVHFNRRGR